MSATNGNGTRTVDPPEGVLPRVGPQGAGRRSAALADEAQTEVTALRKRAAQLNTELDSIHAEIGRLERIIRSAGVAFSASQEDA